MTPFMGNTAATVSIAVSASSQRVQIQTSNSNSAVRVFNSGTGTVFLAFGDVTVTAATTTGLPIGPGVTEVLRLPSTHVAAIGSGSTGTIYFTPGEGI